jgi:hypothetical protein
LPLLIQSTGHWMQDFSDEQALAANPGGTCLAAFRTRRGGVKSRFVAKPERVTTSPTAPFSKNRVEKLVSNGIAERPIDDCHYEIRTSHFAR